MSYNQDALNKLFQEYYIQGIQSFAPIVPYRTKAEPQLEQAIIDAGYNWMETNNLYLDERVNQAIIALPNNQFVWTVGNIGKVLKNPEKLQIWLDGRGDAFLQKMFAIIGTAPQKPIEFQGTGTRNVPYNPTPADPTDSLIAKLKKQAGSKKALPSDLMIDLGLKAKKEKNQKLLDFLATMTPVSTEGVIKRSQLNNLISEIAKCIVKETYIPPQREKGDTKDDKDFHAGVRSRQGKWPSHTPDPWKDTDEGEDTGDDKWVEDTANRIWKDPTDIGQRYGNRIQNWKISQVHNADSGETVYQLKKVQTIARTRFIIKRDGKWFYLDQKPDRTKKWVEIPDQPPQPSQSPETKEIPVKEMTGTAAVSPIQTPFAFKKKKTMEDVEPDYSELATDSSLSSRCCGAPPLGQVDSNPETPSGICSKCKNHTTFEKSQGTDEQSVSAGAGAFSTPNAFKKTEEEVNETTTTGAVSGYNIPAFLSKRGGSEKGVEGSKSLGYELTAIGKKDMQKRGNRLYETEAGQIIKESLSTDELQQYWLDDKDGEYIQLDDNGVARYIAHGVAMETISPKFGNIWAGIREWMKSKGYYPNIWHVNERGNVELYSRSGKALGGLV